MSDDLFTYYEEELRRLQEAADAFRRRNPKLAGRLELGESGSADPHVDQLLQGFALIAARLHRRLDDGFGDLAEELIDRLYPHLTRPIPSRTIVKLEQPQDAPGGGGGRVTHVPRGTELRSDPLRVGGELRGLSCRFRTLTDAWLAPVEVVDVRLSRKEGGWAVDDAGTNARLTITLRSSDFERLKLDRFRFHLAGDPRTAFVLYELIVGARVKAWVRVPGRQDAERRPVTIAPVGFAREESMLEGVPKGFDGYRLLIEYLTFPEKFLFFDVTDVTQPLHGVGEELEIGIDIRGDGDGAQVGSIARTVGRDTLRLGCVPIVNLFPVNAEPIRLTRERDSHPVIVDQRRPSGYEVYRIAALPLVGQGDRLDRRELPQLYARHGGNQDDPGARAEAAEGEGLFWTAKRSAGIDGSIEMTISLVDRKLTDESPTDGVLLPQVFATNRDAPLLMSAAARGERGEFSIVSTAGALTARWLRPPAAPLRFLGDGGARWRLVSHLAANRLSLADGGVEWLRGLLSVYNLPEDGGDPHLAAEIRRKITSIVGVSGRSTLEPVGGGARWGLIEGTEITLELNESALVVGDTYLLAAVLDRFIASFAAVNSFTRLVVKSRQREEVVGKWMPRLGTRPLV